MTFVERRLRGTFDVDPWGLDVDLLHAVEPLAGLRWSISVEGEDVIAEGPALLVAELRLRAPTEPVVIAAAVLRSVRRPLRVLGIPDVAPVGPLLRRFGGVVDHTAEAAALLRAGHLVLARREMPELTREAADAPIVHVTTRGWELGRRWRISFG
jgi:hypothetical protein